MRECWESSRKSTEEVMSIRVSVGRVLQKECQHVRVYTDEY